MDREVAWNDIRIYDEKREQWLKDQKNYVIRFKNDEVLFERERVMNEIKAMCERLLQ